MLLVLRSSSRTKRVAQVVWVFRVAVAILHTVCAHDCTIKTCRQRERKNM